MDLAGLIVFVSAYTLAVASPGPGIAALVARVIGRGTRGAPAYIAGFVIGDLIWFTVTAFGLAALAQTFATLFTIIKWAGVAYLLYLAWKMWTAPVAKLDTSEAPADAGQVELFLAGLSLTLANPKVIAFFLALLPTIVDLSTLSLVGMLELASIMALILSSVPAGYALLADRARRFISSPREMRIVNRLCGAAIVGAAATVAMRS
jgi:threonine/homoserine/homoserine lactone efflux protein